MTGHTLGARRQRRAAAWIAATIVGTAASGQSIRDVPEPVGIKAGPVAIAPSLTVGYAYDTNPLAVPEDLDPPADNVLTVQPAFQLTVPFSNSMFRFGDVLRYVDYKETPQSGGKTSNDALADLTLNFGSGDTLDIVAHNVSGVAETLAFDPGAGTAFQGNSFQLHSEAVSFFRELAGARGYRLTLQRNAVRFDPSVTANFFNFRGFDGAASFLQPLSLNTRVSFGYLGSRYEHSPASDPSTVFRYETGDTIFGQIEGRLGPRQPYIVRLGWQRLSFSGPDVNEADQYSGVVGQLKLSAIVGGGTIISAQIERQPYRSFVSTYNYYVSNLIGVWVERYFPQGTNIGGDVAFWMNGYNQPATDDASGATYYRQDRRIQLEAYANLALAKQIMFRVSLARNRRYSNAPGADYNESVVFGGFVFGWI